MEEEWRCEAYLQQYAGPDTPCDGCEAGSLHTTQRSSVLGATAEPLQQHGHEHKLDAHTCTRPVRELPQSHRTTCLALVHYLQDSSCPNADQHAT